MAVALALRPEFFVLVLLGCGLGPDLVFVALVLAFTTLALT